MTGRFTHSVCQIVFFSHAGENYSVGEVKDIDQYSTVFIEGPVWWGTYPQVMFTPFDKGNLNGKTIVPFSTHEGSGLGSVVSDLKRLYPKSNFKQAFSIYRRETRKDLSKVD